MAALSFKLTRNDVSPTLSRMAAEAKNPRAIFRAMGTTFMSLTMGSFKDAAYRPSIWPAKKDGSRATLQKSGTLSRSFHLTVSSTGATVSNPMVYAAIHQFGAKDHQADVVVGTLKTKHANHRFAGSFQNTVQGGKGIPPRPYFPVIDCKLLPKAEEKIKAAGARAAARQCGHRLRRCEQRHPRR
jgi:phage gpG-like protein